jgi:hypothetical protein
MNRRDFLARSAGIAAVGAIPLVAHGQARSCPPPTLAVAGGTSATTTCPAVTAADWQTRIAAPGVVWYHNFDTDAEMNQFRWADGFSGGNDPTAASPGAGYMIRVPSGGPGNAPYIQITNPGTGEPKVNWWRPFSALAAPGNGRTTSDPGAGKPIRTWAPTSGSSTLNQWGQDYYGPSTYQQPFYIQLRVMSDPRRFSSGYTSVTNVGKKFYLTTTTKTLTSQEIVTYSGSQIQRMYVGGSPPLETLDTLGRPGQQVGGQLSTYPGGPYCDANSNPGKCWAFSTNAWDTLLYVITPGSQSGTGATVTSGIQVYAANAGVTTYTKVWDELFTHQWDQAGQYGWNALTLNVYQNNLTFPGQFWQSYAQIIFSTQMIACPLV